VTENDTEERPRPEAADCPTLFAPPDRPASATLRAAPAAGQRVGKYIIERTLGQGGMGIVVAARHETLDELVAIKLLHPKAAKDALQVERFVREARATVRIKSEHVVRVLDAGADETTGAPFIVMELLEGQDLGLVLAHHGPVSAVTAVDYLIQICEGVGAAHALGIVHRDLKPSNFFLTQRPDGTPLVKVLDFGISKAARSEGTPDPRLTETQAVFGSPTYMSPEQIRSSKNVDARSDVWSLGVALFELLTGKLPFMADNVTGLLASVIADAPFPVSSFAAGVPPGLETVVLGCLEKDASRRISSAAELAMRLVPFASPDGVMLATRVERSARASGSSPSIAPAPPISPSAPAPAATYGDTGTDLSATSPAAFRARARNGSGRGAALLLAALVLVVAVGGLVYAFAAGRAKGAPSTSTLAPPPAPAAPPPSVAAAPPESATPVHELDPTQAPPVGRRVRPGAAGHGRPGPRATASARSAPPASSPPASAPSPSPNLDSRF
jgi:eukaryotic-like serine/threonine-protein kinase